MPGQPPIQPFHRRDLSLLSSGLSRTGAAPTLLWAGFIIQMEHYNGLYSDSIQITTCSKVGFAPINFKPPPQKQTKNVYDAH